MKIFYFLILSFLMYALVRAQVDLEINNGMTVETTGGVYIEVSGDVIENGSGYLKGVVKTGDRGAGGVSSFAGLNLASGGVKQITRTTGTAFSSLSPKSFLRSYELDNSGGSAFTANVTSAYVSSGSNDESNGITTPFIYKKVGTSTWSGYPNNTSSANVASAANVDIPVNTSNLTIAEGIGVAAKIFLEGPYAGSSSMSTTINGSIPNQSPYTEEQRTVSTVPASAVDWVLVQLRNTTSPFAVVSSHSAFVNSSGFIIDDAGNTHTGVPASASGNYKISIKHRNHLEVMTNTNPTLNWESN